MNQILTYIAPPTVGAFIGYMTNYVAIRMLFRPLNPWRIFGIRLPMTPGVIPSKRRDLAINIGKMVGSHLLTSADVSKALSNESFCRELESVVDSRVNNILNRNLGPLTTIIPKRFQSYFDAGVKILRWRALKIIHNHLDSEAFGKSLSETISQHINDFLAQDLNSWLGTGDREHLFRYMDVTIAQLLSGPGTERWIREYIDNKAKEALETGKSPRDLLPDPFIEIIINLVDQEVPGLLAKAADLVHEPEMQDKIVHGICAAIANFMTSLGPMAALAGSFLSPELIESKVREYLQAKGGDISTWLNNDIVKQKTSALINDKINSFLEQPLIYLLSNMPPQRLEELRAEISLKLTRIIKNPKTSAAITSMVKEAFEAQSKRPTAKILNDLFGTDGVNKGKQWACGEVFNIIRSSKVKTFLDNLINNLVNKVLNRPIGALKNILPKAVQSGFAEYLVQQTHDLLSKEVPGLVDSLNIRQIVTKKVDSLDLLHLESLLLSIMEEQFKYINLFGGLLGFLIGLLNLAFII